LYFYTCEIHGQLLESDCVIKLRKDETKLYRCKPCAIIYRKKHYQDNKEKVTARNNLWRANNRERVKANDARVRRERPELAKGRVARYREKNKENINIRARVREYGITIEQYHDMIKKQNNKCAICSQEETKIWKGKKTELGLDHCHKSGVLRELLCFKCNIGIGMFHDNQDLLLKAIAYLRKHNLNNQPITEPKTAK
jgi:hypothetical protein